MPELTNLKHSRGIGLIEVLVAIILLSIGFLATARMQSQSLRFSQTAYHQLQASFIANEIIDRMRSNIAGVDGGYYDNQSTSAGTAAKDCATSSCSAQDIARSDLSDFSLMLHPSITGTNVPPMLPSSDAITAKGEIIANGDRQYTVRVSWAELVDDAFTEQNMSLSFVIEKAL